MERLSCSSFSHRDHRGTENRTSTEKPKGLRRKQRRRKTLCLFHLTLCHYGYCIGSHREHGETEDRTSTEKPKGLKSKQRHRKTYVFAHLTLCHYGYWNTEKVKLLLCLFRLTLCHYVCHLVYHKIS